MTPLFVFLFSVPCLTALFMITFQLIEEHTNHPNALQPPYEGFGNPAAHVQFSSFREIVATEPALSPLQSWANAGNPASPSITPLAAAPLQQSADIDIEVRPAVTVRQSQPAKARTKRHIPVQAKRTVLRRPQTALPLLLPNQHAAAKPPTQPVGL
jgi:hypothetical protein